MFTLADFLSLLSIGLVLVLLLLATGDITKQVRWAKVGLFVLLFVALVIIATTVPSHDIRAPLLALISATTLVVRLIPTKAHKGLNP